jgi:hypothetical protein
MAIGKYKIVFFDHIGEISPAEFVTFDCADPLLAVRAYGSAVISAERNMVKFKVYPAENEALVEVAKGAGIPAPAADPAWDNLPTPESSWISKVTWRGSDKTIGIHPNAKMARDIMVYVSDYDTFCAFRTWVDAGGSAGEFYNANIKGLPRLIK